tara:strand:- start:1441 stop:1797 length:357 start_codon:yes stop_codon:yes gene_type:complete
MEDRNQKMKEFYRRKVERLEEKNDKLKFTINQIQNEDSDNILMKLYETEYGSKSESRIIKDLDFIDNDLLVNDLVDEVYYNKVREFFVDYVMSNNELPFNPKRLLNNMKRSIKVRKMF